MVTTSTGCGPQIFHFTEAEGYRLGAHGIMSLGLDDRVLLDSALKPPPS